MSKYKKIAFLTIIAQTLYILYDMRYIIENILAPRTMYNSIIKNVSIFLLIVIIINLFFTILLIIKSYTSKDWCVAFIVYSAIIITYFTYMRYGILDFNLNIIPYIIYIWCARKMYLEKEEN
ncbi:hypothetical protein RJG79_08445 [Mycoplasmatota bacterium WC44]